MTYQNVSPQLILSRRIIRASAAPFFMLMHTQKYFVSRRVNKTYLIIIFQTLFWTRSIWWPDDKISAFRATTIIWLRSNGMDGSCRQPNDVFQSLLTLFLLSQFHHIEEKIFVRLPNSHSLDIKISYLLHTTFKISFFKINELHLLEFVEVQIYWRISWDQQPVN